MVFLALNYSSFDILKIMFSFLLWEFYVIHFIHIHSPNSSQILLHLCTHPISCSLLQIEETHELQFVLLGDDSQALKGGPYI